ncbi:MAG: class I SAM-dependent methyltransferase [Clostridia bacterium]|nr:class I SAM-dependent methyltransferase [Clostridia bacterium]
MNEKPYYFAYEKRYQAVYEAGFSRWGHSPDDAILYETLKNWVETNDLQGKKVAEFACGEGACGVILSELGCIYTGFDISPSAVKKAKESLAPYPNASVWVLDMVKEKAPDAPYDAALDCMGLHMLITDSDRNAYLKNACAVLKENVPMLFFRESYRKDAYEGEVSSFEHWKRISGEDYDTPMKRTSRDGIDCYIPLLAARAKTEKGYREEMSKAGFDVEDFVPVDINEQCAFSATVFVRKAAKCRC